MIIDADTHISPIRGDNRITAEKLVFIMDEAGVDKAVTWLQPECNVSESNKYIYESKKRYPDRILGFGWANPKEGVQVAIENVKRCVHDYGFFGVKLNGAQNNFYIDDEELAFPVIEEIAKTGKIIAFHVGADFPDRTHPKRVAKIADKYPENKILMVHMGGAGTPDLSDEAIKVAKKYPNIYLIGSNISSEPILKAVHTLGANRVCFGSDTPFLFMANEVKRYNVLLNGEVKDAEKKMIMGGNIAKLFELE